MAATTTLLANVRKGIGKKISKYFHNEYSKVNLSWYYHKYLKHAPAGKLLSHHLFKNKTSFYDAQEYLHGIEEIFIDEVYRQHLPGDAFIIDCGAHIGLSIIYLKKLFPSSTIVAFEPDAKNFDLLEKNITSHQLQQVQLLNKAVWKQTTTISFHSEGGMSSKIVEDGSGNNRLEAVRLKDFLDRKIDFLKLDIEGAEYEVIKDIKDSLHNVQNMFVEYHGSFAQNKELVELLEIFDASGFRFYIKEAAEVYKTPFIRKPGFNPDYDVQLNIFCFRQK